MTNTDNRAIKITLSGRVQGVGFRFFIERIARNFGLTGYVKNLYSGEVEIYAEGRSEFLEELLRKARAGPSSAHVEGTKVEWLEFKKKYNDFEAE